MAALVAAVAHDFLLVGPQFEFTMSTLATTAICLSLVVLAFAMIARARDRSWCRLDAEAAAQIMHEMAETQDWDQRARSLASEFKRRLDITAVVYPVRRGKLGSIAGWHAPHDLIDLNALEWAAKWGVSTGKGTGTIAAADFQFHPIGRDAKPVAVLGLHFDRPEIRLTPGQRREVDLLLGLCAIALLPVDRDASPAPVKSRKDGGLRPVVNMKN